MRYNTHAARRAVVGLALLAAAFALQGCSYARHRYEDAAEIMDLGFTFTRSPQFAAWSHCPITQSLGYGKLDGTFVGLGGGKAGVSRHQLQSAGFLFWGREESSWGSFDRKQANTVGIQGAGLLALAQTPEETGPRKPTCSHYLHLGWVGVVWNMRWLDIPDFLAGIFFMDPLHDDGPNGGWWFNRGDDGTSGTDARVAADEKATDGVSEGERK